MDKQFTITFTEQELSALRVLLNEGVKVIGLDGAEAAAVLDNKIKTAIRASQEEVKEKEKPAK